MVKHTPPNDREQLTQLYHDFHFQYGVTLGRWAGLEQSLCTLFSDLCGFVRDSKVGDALFFSGRSFATRADLLSAAIRVSGLGEPEMAVLKAVLKKARQYSTSRNAIAHGVPQNFVARGTEYQGWRIKEHERAWEIGGIGVAQLREAEKSFLDLDLACHMIRDDMISYRRRRRKRLKPPEWYLELVQALPKHAYSQEEGQTPKES
jgi:hypothetical protein